MESHPPHHHPPTPSPSLLPLPLSPYPPPPLSAPLPAYTDPALALNLSPYPPRPRLKRSHASADSPAASFSASESAAPAAVVVQPAPGHESWGAHLRGRSAGSSLDPIKEWPAAEAADGAGAGLGLQFGGDAARPAAGRDDQEPPRRATKRLRVAPDHEAFERLSLASPAGGNAVAGAPLASSFHALALQQAPSYPFAAPPRPAGAQLPAPPLPHAFPAPISLPLAPSSSPTTRTTSLPAAPPTSPVSSSFPAPVGPPAAGTGLPTVPWAQSAFFRAGEPALQRGQEEQEEVTMLPARGSIDLSPHRVYVASLDDDSPPPSPSPPAAAEPVAINPLALRLTGVAEGLPAALLARLKKEAERATRGEVVLYRPPPNFHALGVGEDGEGARARALRERRERREESWAEFERMREREEALHDAEALEADEEAIAEGMDVEMEL
ncbi:hypothetical protein JCM10449v2_006347 [Rhodotorula kratochvilovae]